MECSMDHIVLNVEDEEKMIFFYSELKHDIMRDTIIRINACWNHK